MKIPCYRCGKSIDTPNNINADYIMAADTIVTESEEVFIALKYNKATRDKLVKMAEVETYFAEDGKTELTRPKYPDLKIEDNEYDVVEVPDVAASKILGDDLVKVIVKVVDKQIQKTGIICPGCYRDTDFLIWGVHKK